MAGIIGVTNRSSYWRYAKGESFPTKTQLEEWELLISTDLNEALQNQVYADEVARYVCHGGEHPPPPLVDWLKNQKNPVEREGTTEAAVLSAPEVPELTALLQQLICSQGKSLEPDERLAVLEEERSSPRLQDDNYNPRTFLNIACMLSYSEPFLQVFQRESPRMLIESFFGRLFEVKQAGEVQDLARAIAYVEHRFKKGIQDSLKCWQQFQDSSSKMKHEAAQSWEQICASRARMNQEAAQGLEDVLGER